MAAASTSSIALPFIRFYCRPCGAGCLRAMTDSLVNQLTVELKRTRALCANATAEMETSADTDEKGQQLKFQKRLDARSRLTSLDISRVELEKEQKSLSNAGQEVDAAEQMSTVMEKREQDRIEEIEKNVASLSKSLVERQKDVNMREAYQDIVEKLAEMHTVSRQSQNFAVINEHRRLEDQVASLELENNGIREKVQQLADALNATGYEVLHETRRSMMGSTKTMYTGMKDELFRLRVANHSMRIRSRTAQANFALER